MIMIDEIVKYVNGKRANKKYDAYFKNLIKEGYSIEKASKFLYEMELELYNRINTLMNFHKMTLAEIYDTLSKSPEFDMYREAGFEWPTYNAFVKWRERFTAHLKHRDFKKTSDVRIIDELVSVLDRKIKSYPQIEIKPAKIITNENISLFLEFSDWQIGAHFTKRDLSNIIDNEYNYDILTKRLSKWVEKTTKLITEYSKIGYNINRLIFNCLGDMVEGELIFKTQTHFITGSAFDQVIDGSNLFSRAFYEVIKVYRNFYDGEIVFNAVFGNHGRLTKYHHQRDNFDLFVYEFMRKSLENVIDVFNIVDGVYPVLKYRDQFGNLHIMTHGNEVRNWGSASLPYYGMDKRFARYTDLINERIDYWHLGHHHTVGLTSDARIIVNGTPMGITPYALKIGANKIRPSQNIIAFDKKGLLNLHILDLT